jgi:predicted secreted protein
MTLPLNRIAASLIVAACLFNLPAKAQEHKDLGKMSLQNVLNLDSTVTSPITPDTAVITLFAERSGADAAAMTQDINAVMADALKEAKASAGVEAATGNFQTYQQYDPKGVQNGWVVRSDLILKSKDFVILGKLAGSISKRLKIASNGFEVSRELKQREEDKLLLIGIDAFKNKATIASKALGFASYTIREVNLQQANIGGNNNQRPMMMMASAKMASADVPIEAGSSVLSLTVRGSVVMK